MSQNDYEIAVGDANTGPTMRAAINAALQALASNNLGTTTPSTTYAGMWWADTTSDTLWQRNAANNAWIDKGKLSVAIRIGVAAGNVAQVDQAETSVASASSITLATTLNQLITGTTNIGTINSVAGRTNRIRVETGTFDLTHSAGLNCLQTGATIKTRAGDTFDWFAITSSTGIVMNYTRADGTAIGAKYVMVVASRDAAAASGNVAYTGFGGKPKRFTLRASIQTTQPCSVGESNGTFNTCLFAYNTTGLSGLSIGEVCYISVDGVANQSATTASMDNDGATLAWIKTGSPTGTITLVFTAEL